MRLTHRWHKVSPQGVYALYDDGERVGPLPIVYSHYQGGFHYWEVLVPAEKAENMRGMHVDQLPARTMLVGTLSDAVDPHQWHAEGEQ